MDRLSATHLKAIQQEREQYLEKRYWQYVASAAQRKQHSLEGTSSKVRDLLRFSSLSLLLIVAVYLTLFLTR
jgi:hypothetical protein